MDQNPFKKIEIDPRWKVPSAPNQHSVKEFPSYEKGYVEKQETLNTHSRQLAEVLVSMTMSELARAKTSDERKAYSEFFRQERSLCGDRERCELLHMREYHAARTSWWEKAYTELSKNLVQQVKPADVPTNFGFEIQPEELKYGEILGRGTFGDVYQGTCRGKEVAIKVLKGFQDQPTEVMEEMKREMSLMSHHSHPNLLRFLGACLKKGSEAFVTELAPRGSLLQLINSQRTFVSFNRKISIAQQIAAGMQWLHSLPTPLLHLDLKPGNILIMSDYSIRICDFGISRFLEVEGEERDAATKTIVATQARRGRGTIAYMAPEMFEMGHMPNEKCDIYAYGIILQELLASKSPWISCDSPKEITFTIDMVCNGHRPDIPKDCTRSLVKLIEACWHQDPEKRPPFKDIKEDLKEALVEAVGAGDENIIKLIRLLHLEDGRTVVPWADFQSAYMTTFKHSTADFSQIVHFRHFLGVDPGIWDRNYTLPGPSANDSTCMLSMEKFFKFREWWGPLTPAGNKIPSSLAQLAFLTKERYFWGDFITDAQAEHALTREEKNCRFSHKDSHRPWLVRCGLDEKGTFILSYVVEKKTIQHEILKPERMNSKDSILPLITMIQKRLEALKLSASACVPNPSPPPNPNPVQNYIGTLPTK